MPLTTPSQPNAEQQENQTISISPENLIKFHPDGSEGYFPGQTTLCHLRATGTRSQREIHSSIVRHFLAPDSAISDICQVPDYIQLPPDSFHMTVLDVHTYVRKSNKRITAAAGHTAGGSTAGGSTAGDITADQVAANHTGPDNIPSKEQIAADTAVLLRNFSVPEVTAKIQRNLPVKMKFDTAPSRLPKVAKPLVVPLVPFDEEEARKIAEIRAVLAEAFGMSAPSVEYKFHVTLFYPLKTVGQEVLEGLRGAWEEAVGKVDEEVGSFLIERVELCEFLGMRRFEIVGSVDAGDGLE